MPPLRNCAEWWSRIATRRPFTELWLEWDIALKKTLKANEQNRPDVAESRADWCDKQPTFDTSCLVFVDESAAKTNMIRLYGRALVGDRCHDSAPHGHWTTTTMIGSVRLNGETTCLAMRGGTTSEVFREYVRQILAPTLSHGDIVIVDNLTAHKNQYAQELIEAAGARVIFLPPYSPDLNPIEKMWSKVKQSLRSSAARTYDSLLKAMKKALDSVTADDVHGWFQSCGYTTF